MPGTGEYLTWPAGSPYFIHAEIRNTCFVRDWTLFWIWRAMWSGILKTMRRTERFSIAALMYWKMRNPRLVEGDKGSRKRLYAG